MKKQYGLTAQGEALPIDGSPNNRQMPNSAIGLPGNLRKAIGSAVREQPHASHQWRAESMNTSTLFALLYESLAQLDMTRRERHELEDLLAQLEEAIQ